MLGGKSIGLLYLVLDILATKVVPIFNLRLGSFISFWIGELSLETFALYIMLAIFLLGAPPIFLLISILGDLIFYLSGSLETANV